MKNVVVIYHKDCADGLTSAAQFYNFFGRDAIYIGGVYGEEPPCLKDNIVYLVDFSYPAEVMKRICKEAICVIVLDHHAHRLEELSQLKITNLNTAFSSTFNSGCFLAQTFLRRLSDTYIKEPPLLQYIEDRDLWKFELADTKSIMAAVYSYPQTIVSYVNLLNMPIEILKREGKILRRVIDKDVEYYSKKAQLISFEEFTVPIVNCPESLASEVGNQLAELHPFAMTYSDSKGERRFSLRSKTHDVSAIARKHGGGGHKFAAGFKIKLECCPVCGKALLQPIPGLEVCTETCTFKRAY